MRKLRKFRRLIKSMGIKIVGIVISVLIVSGGVALIFGNEWTSEKKASSSKSEKTTTTKIANVEIIEEDKVADNTESDNSNNANSNTSSSTSKNHSTSNKNNSSSKVDGIINVVETEEKPSDKEDNSKEELPEEAPEIIPARFTINYGVYEDGDIIYASGCKFIALNDNYFHVDIYEDGFYIGEVELKDDVREFSLSDFPISDRAYLLAIKDEEGKETSITVIIDTMAPVIENVEDGKFYTEASITISDASLESITINEEEYEFTENTATIEFTESGSYVVVATDKAKNSTTVEFTVDADAPVIERVEDTTNEYTYLIYDANLVRVVVNGVEQAFTGTFIEINLTESGEYTIIATDAAGNETRTVITIDIDEPEINEDEENQEEATSMVTINDAEFASGARINSSSFVIKSYYKGNIDVEIRDETGIIHTSKMPNKAELTLPNINGVRPLEDGIYTITLTADNGDVLVYTLILDTNEANIEDEETADEDATESDDEPEVDEDEPEVNENNEAQEDNEEELTSEGEFTGSDSVVEDGVEESIMPDGNINT